MSFVDLIKKNSTLVLAGAVGLAAGALFFGQGGSAVSELEKKMAARLQGIDAKLRTLDTTSSKVNDVVDKIATLESKISSPLSQRIGSLSTELKSINTSIGAVKTTSGEQIAAANKRLAMLETRISELVELQNKKAMIAIDTGSIAVAAKVKMPDGVRLAIAQSAWLVNDKLNITLAYIYPGSERVRVGMDGRLYELSLGVPEDFVFEGKRCVLDYVGVEDAKAIIRHQCAS